MFQGALHLLLPLRFTYPDAFFSISYFLESKIRNFRKLNVAYSRRTNSVQRAAFVQRSENCRRKKVNLSLADAETSNEHEMQKAFNIRHLAAFVFIFRLHTHTHNYVIKIVWICTWNIPYEIATVLDVRTSFVFNLLQLGSQGCLSERFPSKIRP